MEKYSIGCNIFLNINSTRYRFYQNILNYSQNNTLINYDKLIELGHISGMSTKLTKDEIIGCLYANFLVPNNNEHSRFNITTRAIRDFSTYCNEATIKTSELTLTLDLREKDIKLSFFVMDTVPFDIILQLKKSGWSYNTSLRRCMTKCKNTYVVSNQIENLVVNFEPYLHEFNGTFSELIESYGKKRKIFNDYTVNLNHKGLFTSNSLLSYEQVYRDLKLITRNPVDWGGEPFEKNFLKKICENYSVDERLFFKEATIDGMIRKVDFGIYSITGHAAIIINSVIYSHNSKRLPIIIRKSVNGYSLLIGCNSKYNSLFIKLLTKKQFKIENDWYESQLQSNLDNLFYLLNEIINFFTNSNEIKGDIYEIKI